MPVPTSRTARPLDPPQTLEAALDDDFRLGARDQGALVDEQRQPAEAPLAEDVRDRLVLRAAAHELSKRAHLVLVERAVEVGVELDPAPSQHVREQKLGIEPSGLRGLRQVVGGEAQDLAERHDSSARRCSSDLSASVKSSSPPGSTFSRFSVTLTRWSVTRLSG